jgi:hypothetical protein
MAYIVLRMKMAGETATVTPASEEVMFWLGDYVKFLQQPS